jgi:hypothetical protein
MNKRNQNHGEPNINGISRRDALILGAAGAAAISFPSITRAKLLTGTNNIGLPLVPFTITNNTNKDVFMHAFGTLAAGTGTENYFVSDFNGDCKKFPVNAGPTPYGLKLTGAVTNANFPMLQGDRIYFSIGTKLIVPSTDINGNPLAIIPNSTADPNFNTLWDFIEGNWAPGPGGNTVFQWNTTQVNAFAIAFELDMKGGTPSFPKVPAEVILGFGPGGQRAKIFAAIKAAGAPWSNLIIPGPGLSGIPLRVLQPYYSIHGIGPGSGFPTDQLFDYIHNTIMPFYDQSTTNRLVYAGLLPLLWKGFTSGGKFIFKPDNSATKTTYTFPAPTTGECYGNTIVGDPIDGNSGAIAAALGASILRSTLAFYTGFPVPQTDRNLYYTKPPFFEYAKIIHEHALDNHAFCFGYDEVAQDAGETNQVWNPTSFAVTVRSV